MSKLDEMLDGDKCCNGDCQWEKQEHNREVQKSNLRPGRLRGIKKADLVNELKHRHIDNFLVLLEKVRLVLVDMVKSD